MDELDVAVVCARAETEKNNIAATNGGTIFWPGTALNLLINSISSATMRIAAFVCESDARD